MCAGGKTLVSEPVDELDKLTLMGQSAGVINNGASELSSELNTQLDDLDANKQEGEAPDLQTNDITDEKQVRQAGKCPSLSLDKGNEVSLMPKSRASLSSQGCE